MTQRAPAQRLTDFVEGKASASLPEASYFPGLTPSLLHEWLPADISARLREGFKEFGKRMKGFITGEALVGPADDPRHDSVAMRGAPQHFEVDLEGRVYGRLRAAGDGVHEREAGRVADHAAQEGVGGGTNGSFH